MVEAHCPTCDKSFRLKNVFTENNNFMGIHVAREADISIRCKITWVSGLTIVSLLYDSWKDTFSSENM